MSVPGTARFYFDPGCPWTWITSRWAIEAARARDVEIEWRIFSLRHKNRTTMTPEQRVGSDAQHRAVRVLARVVQSGDNELVGALYTAIGSRIHLDGDTMIEGLDAALTAAGAPASLAAAADDPRLDAAIEASTDEATALVGNDVGVPIIHVDGARSVFSGPVLSPAPTGDAAAELWDAFVALTRFDGVFEIKRTRDVGPQFRHR